jgi:hypothetical protein
MSASVWRPRLVVGLGWLWLVVNSFPGRMTDASFAALQQARSRFVSDAYPPAFSALWRVVEVFVAGPSGMLLLQATLFAAGAFAVLRAECASPGSAWATAALLVFPPLLVPLGTIAPYATMTAFLVVGVAGLCAERRAAQRGGIAAMWIACAVQPSALIAVLPLMLGLGARHGATQRYVRALAIWAAIGVAAVSTHFLVARPGHAWTSMLATGDTAVVPPCEATDPELALRLGVPTRSTVLQDGTTELYRALAAAPPLFTPWAYVIVACGVLVVGRRRRLVVTLAASGLAWEATLLVTTTSPGFAPSLWLVACTCLGLVALVTRRARA